MVPVEAFKIDEIRLGLSRNCRAKRMEILFMTDKQREFLRANLYIVAGFLPGLTVGTAICATSFGRAFLDPTQFPQEVRGAIGIMLALIGSILIYYLRNGWLASEQSKPLNGKELPQSNS